MPRPLPRVILGLALLIACNELTSPTAEVNVAARRLIAGETVGCGLDADGTVRCWGFNSSFFEYGAPPTTLAGDRVPVAAPVPKLAKFAQGVGTHFCGITAAGKGVCWGRNAFGQLGNGTLALGAAADTVRGGLTFAEISVSRITSCGRTNFGSVYCWGINQRGEVGSTTVPIPSNVSQPVQVEGPHVFTSISAGWQHVCGITTGGSAYCWGGNSGGQLGIGSIDTIPHRTPELVTGGHTFVQLSSGSKYTCGIKADSTAYCWGENATGQLGDGSVEARASPTPVSGGHKFAFIATSSGFGSGSAASPPVSVQGGLGHTCALTALGRAYCWGWNGNGQLGDGSVTDRLTPTPVKDDFAASSLSLGGAYTCGVRHPHIYCWGSNANGQLGAGSASLAILVPTAVAGTFNAP